MVKDSTNTGAIKKLLPPRQFYTMHEFFLVCPYSHEELKRPNRARDIMQWRQLGMTWAVLSGNTLVESGNLFGKDHATVIYAVSMIKLALEGYHPLLREKLQEVIDCIEITNAHSNDYNTALIISSRRIESLLKAKYQRINRIK
jgi:hypothetical protein